MQKKKKKIKKRKEKNPYMGRMQYSYDMQHTIGYTMQYGKWHRSLDALEKDLYSATAVYICTPYVGAP